MAKEKRAMGKASRRKGLSRKPALRARLDSTATGSPPRSDGQPAELAAGLATEEVARQLAIATSTEKLRSAILRDDPLGADVHMRDLAQLGEEEFETVLWVASSSGGVKRASSPLEFALAHGSTEAFVVMQRRGLSMGNPRASKLIGLMAREIDASLRPAQELAILEDVFVRVIRPLNARDAGAMLEAGNVMGTLGGRSLAIFRNAALAYLAMRERDELEMDGNQQVSRSNAQGSPRENASLRL